MATHLAADTLYLGHDNGVTRLPARRFEQIPASPPTLLTGMEVNFDERRPTADSVLAAADRSVGFAYTGPSLSRADRVRYEVRLLPRDTTWSATPRRSTRYTNLEPGTYRFEVRARLGDQPPGSVAAHTFTVPPHFYETGWFRLLVGLGLLGLGVGAYRWRTHRLRRRQETLEAAVEERTRQLRHRTEELAEEKEKTEAQAERLAELDEAKNRFFAHISHEFRTPLSLILSPLRDALQRVSDGAATLSENQLRRMVSNAQRLQRLIEQLLDLATLEAGRMELERQPGDLAGLVERAAKAFGSLAEQKEIDLAVRRPDERIETRFDPEKVETMVSNLVSNALKFTPEGGSVAVRVGATDRTGAVEAPAEDERAEGTVRIEVEDTGPGIAPEAQEEVFDRFKQVDDGATRKHEGTGLGLALTSELATLHGGTVEVESTPGEGALFTVKVPLVPVAEAAEPTGRGPVEEGRGAASRVEEERPAVDGRTGAETARDGAATILVVEDNAEMRAYLRDELGRHWHVLEATDGADGWETVQAERPDLVVSDVMMPEVDGFELCGRIKADPELRAIPVLLLTARADEEATLEGLESGADDYVAKPFGPEELRQRIENHLAARRHLERRYRGEVEIEALDAVLEAEEQSFAEAVLEAVEGNLGNPDFGVGDLAEEMALSRRQLTRRLKESVGEPPGEVLRRLRIERAKAHLREGAETVSEVAYAVGFRSPSSFSQSFRKAVGQSPTEYAEQHERG
jgi:signal transduction histidine kinase/DNA-binding response OmpR family regulator